MSYQLQGASGAWEIVCGLEVHAQIISESKLFSGASATYGGEPNAHVSFVDAGFPGMLPVINRECVAQAVRTGLGLRAKINLRSRFDRKNYFYADLPNGYQISQFSDPVVGTGEVEIELQDGTIKKIGITRLHLEQDAGKSMHDQHPQKSVIDLNRAGVGLMEIVSEPDIRSPEEAGAYLREIREILRCLGTCDGNMEEGSMRADVNVSVRKPGETEFRTRCEIKNINSVRFAMHAIEVEAIRQIEIWEAGGEVIQETRLYDPARGETRSMRSKEDAHDYRYFPEPDLLPLVLEQSWVDQLKRELPELPADKRKRYASVDKIPAKIASVLAADRNLAIYYEQLKTHTFNTPAPVVANFLVGDISANIYAVGESFGTVSSLSPPASGAVITMFTDNKINRPQTKELFEQIAKTGKAPETLVQELGLSQITDTAAIDAAVTAVLAANPDKVAEYKSGKDKLFGFFVGQVMKAMAGKGNPALVNEAVKKQLG